MSVKHIEGGASMRALTPAQCQAVAAALANGVRQADLAIEYGVSPRTIYRSAEYARSQWAWGVIEAPDGTWWRAQFTFEDEPVRRTPWYPT